MRHRTLKWKFTVTFISMMALAVTATWCINNWFLEGYYQNYKIGVLEKGYHAIDTIVLEEKKTEEALWRARKMSLTVPLIFLLSEIRMREGRTGGETIRKKSRKMVLRKVPAHREAAKPAVLQSWLRWYAI